MRWLCTGAILTAILCCGPPAGAQTVTSDSTGAVPTPPSADATRKPLFRSAEDGWFDVSSFLDQRFGFLPVAMLITEPAVGYGAGAALAFLDKPLVGADAGFGRPNISAVGGVYTENDTWAAVVGDMRYWLDDRLQTTAGLIYASVNLDFYGIDENRALERNPL